MKRGFTLIELLIAMSVSTVVAAGLYTMFSTVAGIRNSSVTHSENIIVTEALTNLINKDIRMMESGSLSVDSSEAEKKFKFKTQNSLRFNKTLPADITYYVDDDKWLVRREMNTDVLYDMEMRLLPNVSEMTMEFYDDKEYKEDVVKNAKLLKFHFIINDNLVTVFAARTMGG